MTTIITGIYKDNIFAISDSRRSTSTSIHDFEANQDKFFYIQKHIIAISGSSMVESILKTLFLDEGYKMPVSDEDFRELGTIVMMRHKKLKLENHSTSIVTFTSADRHVRIKLDFEHYLLSAGVGIYRLYFLTLEKHHTFFQGSGAELASEVFDALKFEGESFEDRLFVLEYAIEHAAEFDKNSGGRINKLIINVSGNKDLGNTTYQLCNLYSKNKI